MVKLKQLTRLLRAFLQKHEISTKEIGMNNYHMYYRLIE